MLALGTRACSGSLGLGGLLRGLLLLHHSHELFQHLSLLMDGGLELGLVLGVLGDSLDSILGHLFNLVRLGRLLGLVRQLLGVRQTHIRVRERHGNGQAQELLRLLLRLQLYRGGLHRRRRDPRLHLDRHARARSQARAAAVAWRATPRLRSRAYSAPGAANLAAKVVLMGNVLLERCGGLGEARLRSVARSGSREVVRWR